MNTSKLILSFSCGKVNFSRSILLLKRNFYMSVEMEVACLLCLSDDKLPAETFWAACQMTNCPQRRFRTSSPLHLKKNDDLSVSLFWSFCLKGYFYGLPRWRSQWRLWGHWIATLRSQWRVWGHWIATLTLAIMSLVHEFTKVFSRARG